MMKGLRFSLAVLIVTSAVTLGGCADTSLEDAVHAGGKLVYDTMKAAQDSRQNGY